jgi:hypothetical protein
MSAKLLTYFNKSSRIGTLSTASKDGRVDSAVFGSPYMIDENTVVVASSKGKRTLGNLQENPYAMFMIMEPGKKILDWKGVRVYMKMKEYSTSGDIFEMMKSNIAKIAGEDAAKMVDVVMAFEIYEVRPLIDYGQSWEEAIG